MKQYLNIFFQATMLQIWWKTWYMYIIHWSILGVGVVGGGVVTTGGLVTTTPRVVFTPSSGKLPLFLHVWQSLAQLFGIQAGLIVHSPSNAHSLHLASSECAFTQLAENIFFNHLNIYKKKQSRYHILFL